MYGIERNQKRIKKITIKWLVAELRTNFHNYCRKFGQDLKNVENLIATLKKLLAPFKGSADDSQHERERSHRR